MMNTNGHTLGPWQADEINNTIKAAGEVIGTARFFVDARLIAAAPELLKACESALANLTPAYSSDHFVIVSLRAAIAKATS